MLEKGIKGILYSFIGSNSTHQNPANSNQHLNLLHLTVSMTTEQLKIFYIFSVPTDILKTAH